jgi:hypothetical protein
MDEQTFNWIVVAVVAAGSLGCMAYWAASKDE